MSSLNDEFPGLMAKIVMALKPIANVEHGDSVALLGGVVMNSVRAAFQIMCDQDLIEAASVTRDLGSVADSASVTRDLGSVADSATPEQEVAAHVEQLAQQVEISDVARAALAGEAANAAQPIVTPAAAAAVEETPPAPSPLPDPPSSETPS